MTLAILEKYITTKNNIKHIDLPYNEVDELLSTNEKTAIINQILEVINKNKIGFPFKRYFMKQPAYYFDNIFKLDTTLASKPFKFKNIIPKMGFEQFENLFSYKYRNKYRYIKDNYDIYMTINILTDFFTEEPRVKSIGHGQSISPYDYWYTNTYKIVEQVVTNKQDVNPFNLREVLYEQIYEARMGKISQYYTLLKYFKVKRFLDPSCAWGDRLIAAIAHNCDKYLGIDPNTDLKQGHDEIIATFCTTNKDKFKIIYKPIENVDLSGQTFDFVLSSPAPFEGDIYGNKIGQSTDNYKEFNVWFIKYMLVTCLKSYMVLEDKGHFLITILDRLYPNKYAIVELLFLTILYKCKHMFYKGVIGWEGSNGKIIPFWVFKRINKKKTHNKRKVSRLLLEQFYPEIYEILKKKK